MRFIFRQFVVPNFDLAILFPSTHSFQIVNGAVNRMHSYQRIRKEGKKKKKSG